MIARYAFAVAAALAAMAAWSAYFLQKGTTIERVRVEQIGKKIDAKARTARRKVEAKKPAEISVDLLGYCRDCK